MAFRLQNATDSLESIVVVAAQEAKKTYETSCTNSHTAQMKWMPSAHARASTPAFILCESNVAVLLCMRRSPGSLAFRPSCSTRSMLQGKKSQPGFLSSRLSFVSLCVLLLTRLHTPSTSCKKRQSPCLMPSCSLPTKWIGGAVSWCRDACTHEFYPKHRRQKERFREWLRA